MELLNRHGEDPTGSIDANVVPSLGVLLISVAVSLVPFLATVRFSPDGLKERTGCPRMMLWLLFIKSLWRILAWGHSWIGSGRTL